ncbi:flavonoid 3',5'-hydroxylase 1-like protein [Carex littledalei]|uniref:Flavonoid 3',5'-hydroxylase 1-like protein n=1 Tax=Carex littledalei TaxID=544730 RepID=A0A833R8V9_9POAL|nr:flavonoid 3',5'-hydroxylase 1-like protein [Carex littledalei]
MDISLVKELLFFSFLFFLLHYLFSYLFPTKSRVLPPGPSGYPIVGCLPLLGANPHDSLARLARKYGPIMHLKMGSHHVIVASTTCAARVFFKTLDLYFSDRPIDHAAVRLAYGDQDLVFTQYSPRWKLLRKICNVHMLGPKALESWSEVRRSEMTHMLRAMHSSSQKGEPVKVVEMLSVMMANIIGQVVVSRRVFDGANAEAVEFKAMVVELFHEGGKFNIGDYIPLLARLDVQGMEKRMKALQNRFDEMLTRIVREHEMSAPERKGSPDLLDVARAHMHEETRDGVRLNHVNIKALLLNLLAAGTDTTSITIEWAIAELLQNPSILKQAQAEMDHVIGRERRLEESDIPNLPYLRAICKETFRKHPSTPLSLPRLCTQDCEADGYFIPKNSRLLLNVWAIGRDPDVWKKPLEFDPERFMSGKGATMEANGQFELLVFGAGRRMCAGDRMGVLMVEYALGTLLHCFDLELPKGVVLDLDEAFGLALPKAVPVSAVLKPRLAEQAYL